MEKKKRKSSPRLKDLLPDDERRKEVLSRLYNGDPIVGEDGIFTDLLQSLVNASLEGEMDHHLQQDYEQGKPNRRNGHIEKTVRSRVGPMQVVTPRDRDGSHDPQLIKKWERELGSGMDHVILSLYARGQSVEDVRHQLRELYGIEVSAGTISAVTDRVWDEIITWQQRPLASCYAIVYLDAIHFKVRDQGRVQSKAVYSVYAISVEGHRDLLGLYLSNSEGARHWGLILEDIKKRGVEDVLFFSIDGLSGFKQVIDDIFPLSIIQRCIVHMVRNSTRYVSYKDIRAVCSDLRKIYSSADRVQAEAALEAFGVKWDSKYKEIRPKWENNWDELMAFMETSSRKGELQDMLGTLDQLGAIPLFLVQFDLLLVLAALGAWLRAGQ